MEMKSMCRAKRREHARRVTAKVRRNWRDLVGNHWVEDHSGSKTCYAKDGPFECSCRRRHPGNPKVSLGMCFPWRRHHVVRLRQSNRDLVRLVVRLHYSGEEDQVALL